MFILQQGMAIAPFLPIFRIIRFPAGKAVFYIRGLPHPSFTGFIQHAAGSGKLYWPVTHHEKALHPLQRALAPGVDEGISQQENEQEARRKSEPVELVKGHCPGEKKHHFNIKNQKD